MEILEAVVDVVIIQEGDRGGVGLTGRRDGQIWNGGGGGGGKMEGRRRDSILSAHYSRGVPAPAFINSNGCESSSRGR